MPSWLQSGRRRDICILLADAPENGYTGQRLKSLLEAHYDDHLEPRSFYGSLSALVEAGFVTTRTEGIQDYYALTAPGRERLIAHYEWMETQLADSVGGSPGE